MKYLITILLLIIAFTTDAQNVGIGTSSPQAKLHVNGDIKLLAGDAVNKFSRDSLFSENSHNNVPTEKAIKDYLQKGNWITGATQLIGPQAPLARGITNENLTVPIAVQIKGSTAYVASFNGSFQLVAFNVSDPDSIYRTVRVGSVGNQTKDLFVISNYAITITQNTNNLFVFDISNPSTINLLGSLNLGGDKPVAVFAKGNFIYTVNEFPSNKLSIYDFSNPVSIVSRGSISLTTNTPTDVFVQGNFAYVTTFGSTDKLSIYDITNPDIIVPRGTIGAASISPSSVFVNNNFAYVTSQGFNQVNIYNASNPDGITANGIFNTEINNPSSISIANNVAFITNAGRNSLAVYDITNATSPVYKGVSNANLNNPVQVFASGNRGYVASFNNNRLCVFDLDNNNGIAVTPNGVVTAGTQWQTGPFNVLYRSNGYVGIGTSAPEQRLHVVGNETVDGALGVGTTSPQATLHVEGTTALNGNTGIGLLYPNAPLQFAATTANRKIVLYDANNNNHQYYGFGVNGSTLRYQVDAVAANHVFYAGTGSGTSAELMRIKGNGNVGIGTTNPVKPLSFPPSLGEKILLFPGAAGEVGIGVYGNELRLHADNPGAAVSFGTQDNGGTFTQAGRFQLSGGFGLFVNGSIWANGSVYASDERFKQNITPIETPLEKLMQINGVEYEMKLGAFPKNNFVPGRQMGLLAQNVETVVPEAVSEKDGYKGVDYAKLVPLLIESIKELKKEIEILKAKQ